MFLLGFQSRSVNAGNYQLAAMCSFCIAMSQANLWNLVVKSNGSWSSAAVYGLAGATAITSSMWCHGKITKLIKR